MRRRSSAEARESSREPRPSRETSSSRNLSLLSRLPPANIPQSHSMKIPARIKIKRK